jgi:hypothetical protein
MTEQTVKTPHSECPNVLLQGMVDLECEVTVSPFPPLVRGPYTTEGFTCPHGTTFWVEPTGDQIAAWARDGVQ